MNAFMSLCCLLTVYFCCTENVFGEIKLVAPAVIANFAASEVLEDISPVVPDSLQYSSVSTNVDCLVSQNSSNSSLCVTPGCIKTAKEVLSSLNESVDPCEDFYHFACGGWLNRYNIPENKSSVSVGSEVQNILKLRLKSLLEMNLTSSVPEYIKMTQSMYATCMDLESIESFGAEPLKKVLEYLGGWPVVKGSKWDESKFDWVDSLKAFRMLGYSNNILLDLSVVPSYGKLVHILYLNKITLGMNGTNLVDGLNNFHTAAYYKMMTQSAKMLGADNATVEIELLKTLDFEIALANLSLSQEESRNNSKAEKDYTIAQLQEEVPQIPWINYLNDLLNDQVLENDTLRVVDLDFISKFADLITVTEKRVVANYMLWRIVFQSLSLLSKEWRDLADGYNSSIVEKIQKNPRWEQCIDFVAESLKIALSSFYEVYFFTDETRLAVWEIVKKVTNKCLETAYKTDWMDNRTKYQTYLKAKTLKFYIGYPWELFNFTTVQKHYENLTITNQSYFENILRWKKWSTDYTFSKFRKPIIKRDWKEHVKVLELDAFTDLWENTIEFTPGLLQRPFFDKDRPHFMNFGTIGQICGHEAAHAFGFESSRFYKDGNFGKIGDDLTDLYKNKSQCIIDQYNNYTAENGMKINGTKTLGENVADIEGLKAAYLAYQSWVKENGEETKLPCLKFTQNQMFWISAANMWCVKATSDELARFMNSDPHSPPEFRINGAMSNLHEFAKDFNCPLGAAMSKKEKCHVW